MREQIIWRGETKRPSSRRNYKDSLFRKLFNEKEELLSLYNAVHGTDYTKEDDFVLNTLDNALYMNLKNDISFILDDQLNLFEHQSSPNPNMPLRDLFYTSRLLERDISMKSLYSSSLVKIPLPRYIVFYNGKEDRPDREILKLSDMFQKTIEDPDLELLVTVLNINANKNKELMEQCQRLKGYALFVEKVRIYAEEMEIEYAVDRAIDECICEDILAEFFIKHRAEVRQMSILEYDEAVELEKLRRTEREFGREEGEKQGLIKGMVALIRVHQKTKYLSALSEILQIEKEDIDEVIKMIENYPELTDDQIAENLMDNRKILDL